MGVHAFHKRLALPLQLYSPYLCSQTPYGKSFQLLRSNPKLEGCSGFDFQQPRPYEARKFYSFLFNIGVQFGMVNFEIDFVNQNLQCVNEYFIDVSAASSFLDGTSSKVIIFFQPRVVSFPFPTILNTLTKFVTTGYNPMSPLPPLNPNMYCI